MEHAQICAGAERQREAAPRVAAIDATAGALADAPDWPEWLDHVRGNAADDALSD